MRSLSFHPNTFVKSSLNINIYFLQITQQHYDVPQDERTLFVTFSNGYPFSKEELYNFFMR